MSKIIEYECSLCKKRFSEVSKVSGDLTINNGEEIHVWEYCCSKCMDRIQTYVKISFPGASFIPKKENL